MKAIIFDASTLISLAMNGLLPELKKLRGIFDGKFIITEEVRKEAVERPRGIKRFELEALKLEQIIQEKVLEFPSAFGVRDSDVSAKAEEFMRIANSIFSANKKEMHLVDMGEMSCLALGRILDEKKIPNVLAIDERTTRMLVEKPEELKKFLTKKLHVHIKTNSGEHKFFRGFKIIRSAELVYVIAKKGLARLKGKDVLDAMLWAVRFKGCSISDREIEEIKRIK